MIVFIMMIIYCVILFSLGLFVAIHTLIEGRENDKWLKELD